MPLFGKASEPQSMTVDFALFRGDDCLCKGGLNIQSDDRSDEFELTDGCVLFVSHSFKLPACSLGLEIWRIADDLDKNEVLLEAGIAMGVHASDDWESVALGPDHTLAFMCRLDK
jgi:hypothetical protein